jgi:hypothetical protein
MIKASLAGEGKLAQAEEFSLSLSLSLSVSLLSCDKHSEAALTSNKESHSDCV